MIREALSFNVLQDLEAAGFTITETALNQKGRTYYDAQGRFYQSSQIVPFKHSDVKPVPTFSELISALGDNFGRLDRFHDTGRFGAATIDNSAVNGVGDTPEEALANLLIAVKRYSYAGPYRQAA